ncbi:hypothetical protein [Deinococcus sp. 43]|uniref:hypothetical protein n=1 Tax=Deinococcus sp. 43 TaxID=532020 RepID=UPI0024DE2F6A|nr:hypothetical protein [Deinococcus sp. 43]
MKREEHADDRGHRHADQDNPPRDLDAPLRFALPCRQEGLLGRDQSLGERRVFLKLGSQGAGGRAEEEPVTPLLEPGLLSKIVLHLCEDAGPPTIEGLAVLVGSRQQPLPVRRRLPSGHRHMLLRSVRTENGTV